MIWPPRLSRLRCAWANESRGEFGSWPPKSGPTLGLPEALTGLTADEITRAPGFEAEPFSGLGHGRPAAVPLPGEGRQKQFWLSELPAAELEQIEFLVRRAGGRRLMGISHPGGLPAPLESVGETSWRRVELWPGAIIAILGPSSNVSGQEGTGHGSPASGASVTVINTEPKPGRWLNDAAGWSRAE